MMRFNKWAVSTAAVLAMAAATPALAQQITANVSGTVTGPSGAPVAGATVTVTDTRTNFSTTTSTSNGGDFGLSGLETGGPYTVTVTRDGFQTQRLEGLMLSIGSAASLNVALTEEATSSDVVQVVAARDRTTRLAVGPNVVFNQETVELAPTITRDLRDTLRFDPRVIITPNAAGTQQQLSCLGGNNRSNSFTIDGIAQGDAFGLNASAFANRFSNPYPLNSTRQLSIEFAPFDVQYANFTGCQVNVVTKSGSNEFHGSGFGEYSSDGLTGQQQADNRPDLIRPLARNYRWGADFGGYLIKDRVFFYVAYEEAKLGASSTINFGPTGSGVGAPLAFVDTALVDQVRARIQQVYGYDPGGIISNLSQSNRKILTHWTFVLTDKHKLDFTYSRFREANIQPDDGPNAQLFAFGGNFQTQGTTTQTYSARLFSQWTKRLSTELRISRNDLADVQNPLGGGEAQSGDPIPRIQIGVQTPNGNGVLLAGPGFSRAANDLQNQTDQIRGLAKYNIGKHNLLAGFDWNQVSVFNLFVQNATGTLTFTSLANFNNNILNPLGTSTSGPNSTNIADLTSNGLAGVFAQGRGSGDINGAAANWSRTIFSGYFQDKWSPIQNLGITYGVRYDRYRGDAPQSNAGFARRYGFPNTQTFQGRDLIQPRLAVQYDIPESLFGSSTVTFGAAVFGGGDPLVWYSNAFSNTGGSFVSAQSAGPNAGTTTCTPAQLAAAYSNGVFTGLPACIINAQNAGLQGTLSGPVNAVDPNIKLPSVVRANFEFKHTTDFHKALGGAFDNWDLTFSYIHSAFRNQYRFLPISQYAVQQAAIGYPRLITVDPIAPGCGLRFAGIDQGYTGTYTAACNGASSRNGDILLTNTVNGSGDSDSLSFLARKSYEYSIGPVPTDTAITLGYSFTNGKDASNNGATTAASGVTSTTVTEPIGTLSVAPNNYFTPHNITLTLQQRFELIKDHKTTVFAFLRASSGNRFSYTSQGGNLASALNSSSLYSLYVPAGGAVTLGAFSLTSTSGNASTVGGQFFRAGTFATNDPNILIAGVQQVQALSGAGSTTAAAGVAARPGTISGTTISPFVTGVALDAASQIGAFNTFLSSSGLSQYGGSIAPRNAFQDDWFFDLDLRFAQEIPTPVKGLHLEAYSTINNFLNLIGREGNINRGFGDNVSVVGLGNLPNVVVPPTAGANVGATIPVVYNSFVANNLQQGINNFSSLWQVNFGLKFSF